MKYLKVSVAESRRSVHNLKVDVADIEGAKDFKY